MPTKKTIHARQYEITETFLKLIDTHLLDLVEGNAIEMFEIRDIAKIMHIHATHLTDTVKHTTGLHPCSFFQDKIIAVSKAMLEQNELPINGIATLLTYDPSNFTKFFKRFTQQTPKQYREAYLMMQRLKITEAVTI